MNRCLPLLLLLLMTTLPHVMHAANQPLPTKPNSHRISAFMVKPSEGMQDIPTGWKKVTRLSYGNSVLAGESFTLSGGAKAAPLTTHSYPLPKSTYLVSLCIRGKAKARIVGTDTWVSFDVQPVNKFQWVELGTTDRVEKVSVEVAYDGGKQAIYAGLCLEGDALTINPVARVLAKIKNKERVVIVLLGDSVTENARGTGGGSATFETGNPGLMKAFLEKEYGSDVDYITHREPPTWSKIGDVRSKARNSDPAVWPELDSIPIGTYNDTRFMEARQPLDDSKKIHLVNLGKGGADSSYGWSRFPANITEEDFKFNKKVMTHKNIPHSTIRHGLLHYKPDLVIVNFGTNDVNGVHTTWTVDNYIFNIKTLATNLQQRLDCAVILATPHKWNRGVHLANHWEPLMVSTLRDYCQNSGFALADAYKLYDVLQNDGIHPTNPGHAHLANSYIQALNGTAPVSSHQAGINSADLKVSTETITNTKNNIMTLKNPNALGRVDSTAAAQAVIDTMNSAQAHGYNDWRLATTQEIAPMIDLNQSPALIHGHAFQDLAGFYYLQSLEKRGKTKQQGVNFTIGVFHELGKKGSSKSGFVFPVRSTK